MKKQFLATACVVLLLASCSKEEGAVPVQQTIPQQQPAMKKGPVPFSGSMVYQPTTAVNLNCACGSFIDFGTLSGSGSLAHLGASTSLIKPCVAFTQSGIDVGVECGSFLAANGDELYTSVPPYSLFWGPNGLSGTIHVDFAGGTGRFSDATGGFDATLSIDFANTATLTVTSGAINY